MNLIVAVDKNWAIGLHNKLLVSIPADMKFFRETTMGKERHWRVFREGSHSKGERILF